MGIPIQLVWRPFGWDVYAPSNHTLVFTKLVTIGISCFALGIALLAPSNVFDLVLIAWSGLGAAFGPLLLVYALRRPVSETQAIWMIMAGFLCTVLWRFFGLSNWVYEALPGILSGLIVYGILRVRLILKR